MGKSNNVRANLRHYPFGHNALQGTRASGVYAARQSPSSRWTLYEFQTMCPSVTECIFLLSMPDKIPGNVASEKNILI